jgi:hypothetical protein
VRAFTSTKTFDPSKYTACLACGFLNEVNPRALGKPRKFCDRNCAANYRYRQRKAMLTRETVRPKEKRRCRS